GPGMHLHFAALGLLAVCILFGYRYRAAAALFFLGFTYVFLLEEALYLNHFYLLSLISFLMLMVPAHRAFSVDAWRRPSIRSPVAPAWALFLLRFQVGVPYFFGGIAKLNADWLHGEPMRMWLAKRTDFWLVGHLFTREEAVYFFTYGGLLLDLLIVPALLWQRTRLLAILAMATFHVMNSMLFNIGIFPWFMLGATLIFFPADTWARWGRRWLGIPTPSETNDSSGETTTTPASPMSACPSTGVWTWPPARWGRLWHQQCAITAFVGLWVLVQVLMPFRHFLYPGVVHWTEEGHRFSWHMKLRAKQGRLFMYACDPHSQACWEVDPLRYVTVWQLRKAAEIPDMVLQLAHHVAAELREQGYPDIEIYVDAWVSLNGREPQLLIDPNVNLASKKRSLRPADWILPLKDTPPGRWPAWPERPPQEPQEEEPVGSVLSPPPVPRVSCELGRPPIFA
ncbi:MAG TPA: HTTM domain-containing protein, partial [Phycisphaerae bacterium]|nr:HTTM domain-containing protein [Phycisphaerae bacterium]